MQIKIGSKVTWKCNVGVTLSGEVVQIVDKIIKVKVKSKKEEFRWIRKSDAKVT